MYVIARVMVYHYYPKCSLSVLYVEDFGLQPKESKVHQNSSYKS